MQRAVIKPVLFLALWYECGVELGLGGTAAFVVAIVLWMGFGLLLRLTGLALNMLGPRTVRLLLQAALWLGLFWWLAPTAILEAPLFMIAGGLGVLVLAGAKCRELHGCQQDHPPGAVGAAIAGLVAATLALWSWMPIAPLFGYGLLVGLPFGIGWRLVTPGAPRRADARFGDEAAFRDAGLSEDR